MRDHSSDAAVPPAEAALPRRRRAPRTDWRLGGRTVLRWRESLLAVALVSLGVGLLAAYGAQQWLGSDLWATLCIWVGMLVPVVVGLRRSRPIGLLRFRAVDLLYGVVLGILLRLVHGWISAAGGDTGFPSYPTVDGKLGDTWWFTDVVAPVLVAPVIETFFFHVVVLITVYTALRRRAGALAAGITACSAVVALFVFTHAIAGVTATPAVVALALLAAVCAALVLLTGRIWGAVLTHSSFNATFMLLGVVGTFWA